MAGARTAGGRAITAKGENKKKKTKKQPSQVSHVTWEANSDELGTFASYLSISGGLHDG